jgi:Leucine-rich repeat (LRR) protein
MAGQQLAPNAFAKACLDRNLPDGQRNITVEALVTAAEQVVGVVQGEDKCRVYERALSKLRELELTSLGITDVAPIASLGNLESLTIANDEVYDIGPLAQLKNLRTLDISLNKVANLSALKNLTRLVELRAAHNMITNVEPLGELKDLSIIHLAYNRIKDVSPLKALPVEFLDVSNNQVESISSLSALTSVLRIYAHDNNIHDVRDFNPPASLRILNLTTNPIDSDQLERLATLLKYPVAGQPQQRYTDRTDAISRSPKISARLVSDFR